MIADATGDSIENAGGWRTGGRTTAVLFDEETWSWRPIPPAEAIFNNGTVTVRGLANLLLYVILCPATMMRH